MHYTCVHIDVCYDFLKIKIAMFRNNIKVINFDYVLVYTKKNIDYFKMF